MSIYDKWNKNIDIEGLANDVKEAEASGGSGQYKEVPVGKYEVKIDKMELKESSKGDPMFAVQFRIVHGEFENSCLFMNQVITQGFQIGKVNDFLRSLEVFEDSEVIFKNYSQYNDLVLDMMEELDKAKAEFLIEYKEKKGFANYKVIEVY